MCPSACKFRQVSDEWGGPSSQKAGQVAKASCSLLPGFLKVTGRGTI